MSTLSIFEPGWEARLRCLAVMVGWDAQLRCSAEMLGWDARLRCLAEILGWDTRLRCLAEILGWDTRLRCFAEMLCWVAWLRCLAEILGWDTGRSSEQFEHNESNTSLDSLGLNLSSLFQKCILLNQYALKMSMKSDALLIKYLQKKIDLIFGLQITLTVHSFWWFLMKGQDKMSNV